MFSFKSFIKNLSHRRYSSKGSFRLILQLFKRLHSFPSLVRAAANENATADEIATAALLSRAMAAAAAAAAAAAPSYGAADFDTAVGRFGGFAAISNTAGLHIQWSPPKQIKDDQ